MTLKVKTNIETVSILKYADLNRSGINGLVEGAGNWSSLVWKRAGPGGSRAWWK